MPQETSWIISSTNFLVFDCLCLVCALLLCLAIHLLSNLLVMSYKCKISYTVSATLYPHSCSVSITGCRLCCSTGCVLTQAVLESQEEILRAISGINDHLDQLIDVPTKICESLDVLVKKGILCPCLFYKVKIRCCWARMASWERCILIGPASMGICCSGSCMACRCATLWRTPPITMLHTFSGLYSSMPPVLSERPHRPFSRPIVLSTTDQVRDGGHCTAALGQSEG